MTDGGFRPDGTFVAQPLHDTASLTEAFRRAVLRLFVRRELLDGETAAGMLARPHSGFHVHDGVWVPAEDRAFALRLARYCARCPVALERLDYQPRRRHGLLPVGQGHPDRSLTDYLVTGADVADRKLYALSAAYSTLLVIDLRTKLVSEAYAVPGIRRPVGLVARGPELLVAHADGRIAVVARPET